VCKRELTSLAYLPGNVGESGGWAKPERTLEQDGHEKRAAYLHCSTGTVIAGDGGEGGEARRGKAGPVRIVIHANIGFWNRMRRRTTFLLSAMGASTAEEETQNGGQVRGGTVQEFGGDGRNVERVLQLTDQTSKGDDDSTKWVG
jgi:hypothetical protein